MSAHGERKPQMTGGCIKSWTLNALFIYPGIHPCPSIPPAIPISTILSFRGVPQGANWGPHHGRSALHASSRSLPARGADVARGCNGL